MNTEKEEKLFLPDGFFTDWDIIAYRQLIESIPDNGCFAEIGSLIGRSICSVSDIIKRKNLKVIIVDLFEDFFVEEFNKNFKDPLNEFKANINKFGIENNIEINIGKSSDICKKIPDNSLNLIFLDADHSYEQVKDDVTIWFSKVKNDGLISGHDYEWESVRGALDDTFGLENVHQEYNGVYSSNCWYVKKEKHKYHNHKFYQKFG